MKAYGLTVALLASAALAACNRQPPPPPPVPVASAGETACAERAAQAAGVEADTVVVTPTSSTKTGATVYTVSAGGAEYTCVVEVDSTVSSFGMASMG